MDQLNRTLRVADLSAADYDAIYLAGGHGTMWDFRSPDLARLLTDFAESGKIGSAVCHGPAGFLDARLSDGSWLVQDKELTALSPGPRRRPAIVTMWCRSTLRKS
jgi:putative intracellular protease/amidase